MSSVEAGRIGLIETIRARDGRLPLLGRHLERLQTSVTDLGLTPPSTDLDELIRTSVVSDDLVVRLELRDGSAEITTRDASNGRSLSIMVAAEIHHPYQHKTTQREQFGRAFSRARRSGADDAVLVTAAGFVAEGTAWSLFWWDDGKLCTPAADLGILPGVGRRRMLELTSVREEHVPPGALRGRSLFLTNAVRGVVEIGWFQGQPVPPDSRTAELSAAFWPD